MESDQMGERKAHWEKIYTSKADQEVSWYQEHPEDSLELIVQIPERVREDGIE